jgi:hypothetical protein
LYRHLPADPAVRELQLHYMRSGSEVLHVQRRRAQALIVQRDDRRLIDFDVNRAGIGGGRADELKRA